MAKLRMGSKATEYPSNFPGVEDDGEICLRRRPAFARGTAPTALAVLALDISITNNSFPGLTHPVSAFGIPLGRLADNVFQLLAEGEYSQIEVGFSWLGSSIPPKNITDDPPLTAAAPELTVGGGTLSGIDAAPMTACPPRAGMVKGLSMNASFAGNVAL